MFDHLAGLDTDRLLARAAEQRRAADAAETELVRVAAEWATRHTVLDPDTTPAAGERIPGSETLAPLAGEGAPAVAEFAPAELAAVLGLSTAAGTHLVGAALELTHRLPRTWARVEAGRLPAWRARRVAEATISLDPDAAAWVDAQVAPFAHKIGPERLTTLVETAIARFDPDRAAARAKDAADARSVRLGDRSLDGCLDIHIVADALDALHFDGTLDQLADSLAALGDADLKDVRRAKAIGLIADPQTALDLLATDDEPAGDTGASGGTGNAAGSPTGGARGSAGRLLRRRPRITLYVHLHESAVASAAGAGDAGTGSPGIARVEGLGPVTTDQLRSWLGRSDLVVKPVLDLADRSAVDAYEVPDRMAETVYLRNPCCPFPWCTHLSRRKDADHITPYVPPDDGGPPGQTTPENLASICRRHHRLKTHGGWTYTMPEAGLYLWRSPAGRRYLVDHTGTTTLD